MNACRHQVLVPTNAVMFLAALGACALLVLCCLGTGAPVQGWREGKPSPMGPESGQDFVHSWCPLSADQFFRVLMEWAPALPGRVVLWGTQTKMAHVLVSEESPHYIVVFMSIGLTTTSSHYSLYRHRWMSTQEAMPTWVPKHHRQLPVSLSPRLPALTQWQEL